MTPVKSPNGLTVALGGNPNSGKTTLFNALTGLSQKVANYPGVTVEKKEGIWKTEYANHLLVDLPGLYSINASSPDELVARDVLSGKVEGFGKPDCMVLVVDSTNLERNLYLVTQLQDYGIPIVVALTMNDLADKLGMVVNADVLSEGLQLRVVKVNASEGKGLEDLAEAVRQAVATKSDIPDTAWRGRKDEGDPANSKTNEVFLRYAFIERITDNAKSLRDGFSALSPSDRSEKIDGVLTHKIYGPLVLLGVILLVFQMIFAGANVPMNLLDSGVLMFGDFVRDKLGSGLLVDLLVDGVIAGVGSIIVFLPQILTLFLFITILEETGYMARAAFISDRLMGSVGLHGKAFLPLISSFACAVPGIMAARTIENPRDRLATILIAPFMSCAARLPVYTLMIAAFFSDQTLWGFLSLGALLMVGMYLLGVIAAVVTAFLLKKSFLKAPAPPLVLELPPYRMPNLRTMFQNIFSRTSQFVVEVGTVILAMSIVLWALAYFQVPGSDGNMAKSDAAKIEMIQEQSQAVRLENSYAGYLGKTIEPVIEPLGFDWKIGIAIISSFAAREVFVSTMGIIYGVSDTVGDEEGINQGRIVGAIRAATRADGSPAWTPLTAVTLMVFFVLALQCMSTVAVVRKETNTWKWPVVMMVYMTGLAWVAAFATYQIGSLMGF
jgi:ferrous iron transport protein B